MLKSVLVILSIVCFPLLSYSQEWRELFDKSQSLFNDGQWDEAASKAAEAIDNYMKVSGEVNGNYAALLRLGVTTNFELGDFDKSADYSSREKSIRSYWRNN